MNESNGKTRNRRHFTAEDKATILKRHLADKVAISDLCEEYHIQRSLPRGGDGARPEPAGGVIAVVRGDGVQSGWAGRVS